MKKVLAILLATLMVLSLCACGQSAAPAAAAPAAPAAAEPAAAEPAAEPEDILVARWAGPTADYQKTMVKDYTAASVTIDDVDYSDLKAKEILSFQSAKGTEGNYDVVWVNSSWMTEYVEAGYIMPLDEVAAECGVDFSIYDSNLMGNITYDGAVYGVPTFLQCIICAYDTTVFEEKDIAVPTNYDELVAAAETLKKAGTGIAMPASQTNGAYTVWSQLLYSAGETFVNDGKLSINGEAEVAATERYAALVKNACDGSLGWAHDGVSNALKSGAAPLGLVMSGNAGQNHDVNESVIAETVAYFPLFGSGSNTAANQTYWVWAIPANCENPKAAMEYISWLCSYDIEKRQTLDTMSISAITALAEDADIMQSVPFAATVMEAFAQGMGDPQNSNFDALKSDMTILLSDVANGGNPKELLNTLQAKYESRDW